MCTSTKLYQCHIAVQMPCKWCVWWRDVYTNINHHVRYVRVCFLAWWCRASLTGTWGVWPSKLWYPTPFNLKLLLRQASWMPWLHLANGQGVGSVQPQDLPVLSGLLTSLAATHGHLSNGPGLASGIGRCRIQDEDLHHWQRSGNPFFPGGFPWKINILGSMNSR